jgi:hypothetical protein
VSFIVAYIALLPLRLVGLKVDCFTARFATEFFSFLLPSAF